jgi:sodium-dependent dicarboxylate transporter 2/3/5
MMIAVAFLSMWISNTAAALIALPLAISILKTQRAESEVFSKALKYGLAYAASIGGVATLIGSPPNAILVGYLSQSGITIHFLDWILFALPLSVFSLGIVWAYLRFFQFQFAEDEAWILTQSAARPWSRAEKRVLCVLVGVVSLWLFKSFLGLNLLTDEMVAIAGAILLFLIPAGEGKRLRVLEVRDLESIQWAILILFGGGLALSVGFQESGLASWVAGYLMFLEGFPTFFVIWGVCFVAIFLTEITSNTAIAALMIPLVGALGMRLEIPTEPLLIATTIACSFAFMLPIATPPNAIVFAMGGLKIREMAKIGLALNLIFSLGISLFCFFWLPVVFEISLDRIQSIGP